MKTERKRAKGNPTLVFILSIAVVMAVLGMVAIAFGPDHGEPPWPGAVWSAQHDHWH